MKWLRFLPAFLWAIVLAILMLLPASSLSESRLLSYDKLAHLGVFTLFGILVMFGAMTTSILGKSKISQVTYSLTIGIVYGGLLELLQQFASDRSADLYDFFANVVGTILGVVVFYIFIKNKLAIEKLIL